MNSNLRLLFIGISVSLVPLSELRSQVGGDNPTGPAGMFNGNVTTGCSYDPYTGNATRAVTDLVVPGSVGMQPLAFTRMSNSRGDTSAFAKDFGYPGAWRHSYYWELTDEPKFSNPNNPPPPTKYTVTFPDGRVIAFTAVDPGSPAGLNHEPYFRQSLGRGISERFQQLDANNKAYLIQTDGSKVEFVPTIVNTGGSLPYSRKYKATALIDPYGLRTTLTYGESGSGGGADRLSSVTEPGGRWIELSYVTTSWTINGVADIVLDHITAHATPHGTPPNDAGRTVKYLYAKISCDNQVTFYTALKNVGYFPLSATTYEYLATYGYVKPKVGSSAGHPKLASCDDPMYDGPMKKIVYDYVPSTTAGAVVGQLLAEKYNSTVPVSTCDYVTDFGGYSTPIETRGDGPTRQLFYHDLPFAAHNTLIGYTDFKTPSEGQGGDDFGYDDSAYRSTYIDGNSHITTTIREPIAGHVTVLTHPSDTHGNYSSVYYYYDSNETVVSLTPYYLDHVTDERHNTTTYQRNADHTISRIDYPDGGYETFHYLPPFHLLDSHRMTNGHTETFEYYGSDEPAAYKRNLKKSWTDGDQHKTFYDYDSFGRLSAVTDPRGAALGDIHYTTNFEYNTRGQLTITRHPLELGASTRYFIENQYNTYGSLVKVTDELSHDTTYTYDDYQRLTSVTPPIRGSGDTSAHTTLYYYDRAYNDLSFQTTPVADYYHTDSNITVTKLPSGKGQLTKYDKNLRKTDVIFGSGAEQATTHYGYDLVGKVILSKDPMQKETHYFYDARDRLIGMDDPIPTDRDTDPGNSPHHTVTYDYDQAGNKISELRANNERITYGYDNMNRLASQTVPRIKDTNDSNPNPLASAITQWHWEPFGQLEWMIDPRGKEYDYLYDGMNRRTQTTYPPDAQSNRSNEQWHYDPAGNLDSYKNRAGRSHTLSSTVGSEAWNSRDLKSRPH